MFEWDVIQSFTDVSYSLDRSFSAQFLTGLIMSFVNVKCPGCQSKLKIPRKAMGKNIACPKCDKGFKIGKQPGTQASPQRKPASKPVRNPGSSQRSPGSKPVQKRTSQGAALPGGKSAGGKSAGGKSDPERGEVEFFDDDLEVIEDDFEVMDDYGDDDYGDDDFAEDDFAAPALPPIAMPRKKKKKQAKKKPVARDEPSPLKNPYVLIPTIFVGLIALGVFGFVAYKIVASGGPVSSDVPVPVKFVEFSSKNGEFHCDSPEGWETSTGGGSGGVPTKGKLKWNDDVFIRIAHNGQGLSIGGIGLNLNLEAGDIGMGGGGMDDLKPIVKVHAWHLKTWEGTFRNYEEDTPQIIQTGMGEGRISNFTYSTLLGSKRYGCRASMLTSTLQLNAVCQCRSEEEFKKLKPTFKRVIESIH